jgi:serine O-acetyltransferase
MGVISVTDLLVVWGATVALVLAVYLVFTILVFVAVRGPWDTRFKEDVLFKFSKKQQLPSGRDLQLSYPYVLALLTLDNGIQAALLYRISYPIAKGRLRGVAEVIHAFAKFLTHIDVSPRAEIEGGVYFYHGAGVVIGKGTLIGRRVTICQGVTTGSGRPRIGADVTLWAGAKVIGDVTIGDRAQAGANAVVIRDIPPGCIALGVPADRLVPLDHPEMAARSPA